MAGTASQRSALVTAPTVAPWSEPSRAAGAQAHDQGGTQDTAGPPALPRTCVCWLLRRPRARRPAGSRYPPCCFGSNRIAAPFMQ